MSDFFLLDTYGGYNSIAVHSELEVVAYDAGCMVIVWNLRTDSKICLQKHEHEVIHVQFIQSADRFMEMLFTIDKNGNGCLWDLDSGLCVQEIADRPCPLTQVLSSSNHQGYHCFAEKDEDGSSYKISVWTIERGLLALKAKSEEFTDEDLRAICTLPSFEAPGLPEDAEYGQRPTTSFKFVTVEEKCVKLWRFEEDLITTIRKINVKKPLLDAVTSDIIGFIIVLAANGNLLILDSDGKYVSSLEREYLGFSSIACSQENLYLGTKNGTVHTYNVSTLIGSSTKKISHSDLLRPFDKRNKDQEDIESLFAQKVERIYGSKTGKRVLICFQNKNFYVYNTRKEAIDGVYISQHAEEIKAIEWVTQSGKSLVTVSDKLCLTKTKIADSGIWSSKSIDISEGISPKLTKEGQKLSKGGEEKIALTCVSNNPIRQSQIFCGDNKGFVHVVEVNRGEKLHTYNVADVSIASLTSNGYYIIIVFADGACSVFDTSLEFMVAIEKPFKRDIASLSKETKASLKARILENSSNYYQSGRLNQGLNNAHNFRLVTLHSPSSLRLQAFDAEYKTKLFQCSYELEGLVAGFEIHPSQDYLIAVSDQGFFYIFKLETGELRGKVPIMSDPLGIAIDPSGLYLAISVNNNSIDQDSQVRRKWMLKTEQYNSFRGSRTRVLFYEVGTGNLASEISSLFDISSFSFSPNGRFFVAGSSNGCVSIWAIGERLQSTMSLSPELWSSYPLYIKNEYIHEIEEANEEIRNNKIQNAIESQQVKQPLYHGTQNRFERGHPQHIERRRNKDRSPIREHGVSVGTDHARLLKEREMRFLRNKHHDSGREIDHYHQKSYERPRILETPQAEVPIHSHSQQVQQPIEEAKKGNIIIEEKPVQVVERPVQVVEQQTQVVDRPVQIIERPTQVIQRPETEKDNYSIVPPESAYFKVDEPSVQEELVQSKGLSPKSQGSKVPEVGDSFEGRARDPKAFEDSQEKRERETRTSKWDDYRENSHSPGRGERALPYPVAHPVVYPGHPAQIPTAIPQNIIYQSPDGKLVTYQHPIPVPEVREDDSRTDMTPYSRFEGNKSDYIERTPDQSFEERKRTFLVQQPVEVVQQPAQVIHQPKNEVIPPYQKPVGAKYVAPASKLLDLYKRREVNQPLQPGSPVRLLSPSKPVEETKIATDILGRPRKIPAQNPVIEAPVVVQPQGVPIPPHTAHPHPAQPGASAVRPDPIDIDDDLAASISKASNPEDLQKALISGLRQPDNDPMSLERFRREFRGEIEQDRHDIGDIDRVSESNYSIVEQAYKDMDDFDHKVETEHHGKYGAKRLADPRSFRPSHDQEPRKKNLIRY